MTPWIQDKALDFVKTKSKKIRRRLEDITIKSLVNNAGIAKGETSPQIPKTIYKLKILEPRMFPIASSGLPLRTATIQVASSGKDVPKAMTTKDIRDFSIPKYAQRLRAERITNSPPKNNAIKPKTKNKTPFHKGIAASSSKSSPPLKRKKSINKYKTKTKSRLPAFNGESPKYGAD